MFQDALIESKGRVTTKAKYFSLFSIALNSFLLVGLIVWPLFHPLALPRQTLAILLTAPAPPAGAPVVKSMPAERAHARAEMLADQLLAPSHIPKETKAGADSTGSADEVVPGAMIASGGSSAGFSDLFRNISPAVRPIVKPAMVKPVLVSSGVMAGSKIVGADPVYPEIARTARIQGIVVLLATISKAGTVENLRMVSGPPMLVAGAVNAVKTWRYRPYMLNGEPVEVETTINVVFTLGN